jgi:hypothetical protein
MIPSWANEALDKNPHDHATRMVLGDWLRENGFELEGEAFTFMGRNSKYPCRRQLVGPLSELLKPEEAGWGWFTHSSFTHYTLPWNIVPSKEEIRLGRVLPSPFGGWWVWETRHEAELFFVSCWVNASEDVLNKYRLNNLIES